MCRRCAFSFDLARSYGIYSYPLRDLILHLKFRRRERWGVYLGALLIPLAKSLEMTREADLITPVPLHRARERERGYNQAQLLALGLHRRLAKLAGVNLPRLETRILVRARPSLPQSGLHQEARRENVRGVFAVPRLELVRGRSILLIDDVMTTGATVSACAGVLKKAGAKEVSVLTLARATPLFPDTYAFPPVDDLTGGRR